MVEDGGPNDADDRKNGVFADPGGVALAVAADPVTSVSTDSGGGGGGGSIDFITLIMLIGLYLSLYRRKLRIE